MKVMKTAILMLFASNAFADYYWEAFEFKRSVQSVKGECNFAGYCKSTRIPNPPVSDPVEIEVLMKDSKFIFNWRQAEILAFCNVGYSGDSDGLIELKIGGSKVEGEYGKKMTFTLDKYDPKKSEMVILTRCQRGEEYSPDSTFEYIQSEAIGHLKANRTK